ncbi:MAG: hypothetical protein CVU38_10760, partial [Chloroflexi bacterium HGW-Chloroflexi-1]
CWGRNIAGNLGDGTTVDRLTPVDVVGLTNGVQAISAGSEHTCALMESGSVKCWGRNDYGQLGDGTTTSRPMPVDVVGLTSGVQALDAGDDHTCAIIFACARSLMPTATMRTAAVGTCSTTLTFSRTTCGATTRRLSASAARHRCSAAGCH